MSAVLHLPNVTNTPPDGWRYRIPETGKPVRGNTYGAVVAAAAAQYAANNLTAPQNLEELVEKQICDTYPDYCTGRGLNLTTLAGVRRTLVMMVSGTRTLGSWLIRGMPLVTQELAERRAEVCCTGGPRGAKCPFNERPDGCTGCNMAQLVSAIKNIIGSSKTSRDAQLEGCSVCGCSTKVKVWVPWDIIDKNMPQSIQEALPEHCWVKRKEFQ